MRKFKFAGAALLVFAATFFVGFKVLAAPMPAFEKPVLGIAQHNLDHQAAQRVQTADTVRRVERALGVRHIERAIAQDAITHQDARLSPSAPSDGYAIVYLAQADTSAAGTSDPAASGSGAKIDKASDVLNGLADKMTSASSVSAIILGLLFGLAKGISNEKAGPVIKALQEIVDHIPSLLNSFVKLITALCTMLASALKSDGAFGKK